MLKSINKKPKLSEELQNEGLDFFNENSYLLILFSFFFLRFYFSINVVQKLLKFYDFLKIFYMIKFILIIDLFFDLMFLIDCANYFLNYGNIKMARHKCQYKNG